MNPEHTVPPVAIGPPGFEVDHAGKPVSIQPLRPITTPVAKFSPEVYRTRVDDLLDAVGQLLIHAAPIDQYLNPSQPMHVVASSRIDDLRTAYLKYMEAR